MHQGLGPNDREYLQDSREPSVQLNKEPAIVVRNLRPAFHLTPQDDQLMPEHGILGFKPARLRFKPARRPETAKPKWPKQNAAARS
jgi:hypothetical protein